jgi:hypothetical protein
MPCDAQQFFKRRLLRFSQLVGRCIAGGHEGQAVGAVNRVFVFKVDQQHFTDLRLAALHRALDLVGLEERGIGMHRDLELAAAGLVDVGRELRERFGVEIAGGVGSGQVPLGLGLRDAGSQQGWMRQVR